MSKAQKLTNLQLELLKLFKFELPDSQIQEIKTLLSGYFADKASDGMDKLWDQNSWSNDTMDEWKNENLRTRYE